MKVVLVISKIFVNFSKDFSMMLKNSSKKSSDSILSKQSNNSSMEK
jgi:hypothetical protein